MQKMKTVTEHREGLLWKGGRGRDPDTESLQTLCVCGFCFRLCLEKDAQEIGNLRLNTEQLGVFLD